MESGAGTGLASIWSGRCRGRDLMGPALLPSQHHLSQAARASPPDAWQAGLATCPLSRPLPAHSWRASEPQGLLRSQASLGAWSSQIKFPGFDRDRLLLALSSS